MYKQMQSVYDSGQENILWDERLVKERKQYRNKGGEWASSAKIIQNIPEFSVHKYRYKPIKATHTVSFIGTCFSWLEF
jgi:hypothetical protein